MSQRRYVCVFFFVALCAQFARTQATVNESLELYSFWVDGTNGCDCNSGTESEPFKTIGYAATQAVANNQAGKGTHVWIQNGTYRESIALNASSSDTSWPITFEAVNHGQVTVSGSVLYTGWSTYSENREIYTNAWDNNWGVCAAAPGCPTSTYPQPDIMLRQEMVAVNGTVLTEVLSVGQMQPGTFTVDTTKKLIYVWPPSGTDMSTASVDVATNPNLLTLFGKSNMVWRGIVFQYANSCRSTAAVAVTGNLEYKPTNIWFDDDTFQWNNGQGLAVDYPTTYFTISNSSSLHNGDSGFQSYDTQYGLWQNEFAGYNNWRGGQGAYYGCNVAGFHPWAAHNDTLSGFTSQYNQSYGIHWDDDNVNISGSGLIASENLASGLFMEKDPGPISISNSYSCNQTSPVSGAGVGLRNSENVSFTHGVIYNNTGAQISVIGQPGGIEVTDWLTGETYNLISQGFVNTNNTIEGVGSSQLLFSDATLNGTDWTTFLIGFDSNQNTWWNASNSTTPFVVPVPVIDTLESLGGWQLTTLQDPNSRFAEPSGSPETACNVSADANDYCIVANANTVTLNPAGQATFDFTIMPLLKFDSTVNFTIDGVSEVSGLSASSIASVTGGSGTTSVTVSAATSTPVGTYPITLIGNSGNQTHTVTVNLVVPTTSLRLSTDQITFADQQQNTTSPGQSFTIQNFGKSSFSISSITTSQDFAISQNTCGASLAAGKSCTVTITFTPAQIATINGSVTIVDGDATSPQTVSLTGTGVEGPVVSFSPRSLSFGAIGVGSSSSQSVTLTNTGQSTLTLTGRSAISITGTNASDYSQTNNCGTSVAANASCTITVTFKPQDSGELSADVTLTDNASNSPQSVALNGSGVYPRLSLSPSTLRFGEVEVGYSSSKMTSTVTNSGTVSLSITKIALSGTNPAEYSQTNNCVGTLAANATCSITVTFNPTAEGAQDASVTITDDTSDGSNTLSLTGSGAAPTATLSPNNDSFGTITVGKSSSAKVSTLTNTSDSYLLTVSSITITGSNASNFSQTNTCPIGKTLAAGATCTISVTFTPSASGNRTATLTEYDNSATGSHTISLSGSGAN